MFEKIEKFVSCACVSIMAVLVFSNVIARFLFKHSLAVSDEMSTYLFVLMSFMGTAIAARRRAHLGLSIITDHVSPVSYTHLGGGMVTEHNLNTIRVRFPGATKTFILDAKFPQRPTFENDADVVAAYTEYTSISGKIEKLEKQLKQLGG